MNPIPKTPTWNIARSSLRNLTLLLCLSGSTLGSAQTRTKITSDPIVTDAGYLATGAWADYDNGYPDLLLIRVDVAGPNLLHRNGQSAKVRR